VLVGTVVVRRGFGTLVVAGLAAAGGVEAITNEVTSGPACVVAVEVWRTLTWRERTFVAAGAGSVEAFSFDCLRWGAVVVTASAVEAPNQQTMATTANETRQGPPSSFGLPVSVRLDSAGTCGP
jgi:hypothetical protein